MKAYLESDPKYFGNKLFVIFFLFYCVIIHINPVIASRHRVSQILYRNGDPVTLLNSTTIKTTIYRTGNAWLVNFFLNWCPHCANFASVFKRLGAEIKDWENIVKLAAIDCADERNIRVCKEYEVGRFPTLLFFPPFSSEETLQNGTESSEEKLGLNKGELFPIYNNNVTELKYDLIETLEPFVSTILGHVNTSLTTFNSVWEYINSSRSTFTPTNSTSINLIILLFEKNETGNYFGKELALRLSSFPEIRIIRFHEKNPLYTELGLEDTVEEENWPIAGYVKSNLESGTVNVSKTNNLVRSFQSAILKLINQSLPDTDTYQNIAEEITNPVSKVGSDLGRSIVITNEDVISLEDLIHAVRNSLRNEIGITKTFTNVKLKALQDYVYALSKLFPSDKQQFTDFLVKLETWLFTQQNIAEALEGSSYIDKLTELETEYNPWEGIKPDVWANCKGTVPGLRGYTCSLWRLFHSLTIFATYKRTDGGKELSVLPVIYGYVKNFFGCGECANHFVKMVEDEVDGALNVTSGKTQALWLWKAHNKVNVRLKGAPTEDPGFPKELYPNDKLCPSCHTQNTTFDEEKVFEYLVKVYSNPVRTLRMEASQS